jgi:teichuronic acid biosynthesis glycosyltransferase TuaC
MIFARREARALRAEGMEVDTFYLRSRTSPAGLAAEFVRFRRELRRAAPDVVHAHFGTVTALFAALGAGGLPLVITYRGSDLNRSPRGKFRAAAGRLLSQLAALKAARIVCVSGQLRDRLWWRRAGVTILPSGVDPEVFFPEPRGAARRRLGWSETERVVLFNSGHDRHIKRLDLAEAAVSRARRRLPGLRLEVMDGAAPAERVPWLMNAADCLLLTSETEGSPTVVQEALACDLPIVSVAVGDAPERLSGVRHTRIVERDVGALATAVAEIVTAPLRTDGHRKIHEFSARRNAARLRELYLELA